MSVRTLADRILRERAGIPQLEPLRADLVGPLTPADKYVFDAAASAMIGVVGSQLPDKIAALLPIAKPAAPATWIEWDHQAVRRRGLDAGVVEFDDAGAEFVIRQGFVAQRVVATDMMMITFAQENDTSSRLAPVEVMFWPIRYAVATGEESLDDIAGMHPNGWSRRFRDELERKVWGFGGRPSMAPLRRRALYGPTDGADRLRAYERPGEHYVDSAITAATRDLMGALRYAIAALSILNAVGVVGPLERPPGVLRSAGSLKPYVARRLVTVHVPKHRTALSYARSQIAQHRKRLHEVRSHWRHLKHQPQAPGWESVEQGGETYWRKSIARHMRGDPDLGVVEHDGAQVQGPRRIGSLP